MASRLIGSRPGRNTNTDIENPNAVRLRIVNILIQARPIELSIGWLEVCKTDFCGSGSNE